MSAGLSHDLIARIAAYAARAGSRAASVRGQIRAVLAGPAIRSRRVALPGDADYALALHSMRAEARTMPRAQYRAESRAARIRARLDSGARCPRRASPELRAAHSAARLAAQAQRIGAAIRAAYPYATPSGRWAGGNVSVRVEIGARAGIRADTARAWSDNGKWSGRDLSVRATITRRAIRALGEGGLLLGGLLMLDAQRVGPAEYRVAWAEQHGRLGLRTARGWLIRDYHSRAATLDDARAEVRAARERRLAAELRIRQQRAECGRIWVAVSDSLAAGNCPAGTEAVERAVRAAIGPVGAVRADVLLSIRDDYFSRRAVAVAEKRCKIN